VTGQRADLMSFRRIADIPFDAYIAAFDSWQLTGHHGELRLGNSLLRGPAKRTSIPTSVLRGSRCAWPAGRCARRCGCG
jgi:hypothetical protein